MKEWSRLERGGKGRTEGKRRGLGERAKGGQVVWCEREGGHAGGRDGRDGNKRANREKQREKEEQKGTGTAPSFDTSSPTHTLKHIHTLTHTRDSELVLASALLLAL